MSTVFFKIGSTDLTNYADIQNFDVNQEDVYQEWTDGNWIHHREVVRTRIQGTFQLGFKDQAAWDAFCTLQNTARHKAGFFPVTVWVNNLGVTATIDAFLDITGSGKWDLLNNRFWRVITIHITQR